MAIGNIIGSNVFNILLILSVSSMINPLHFSTAYNTDIYVMAGGTAFVFLTMFVGHKNKLARIEGFLLLAAFIAYTIWLIMNEG